MSDEQYNTDGRESFHWNTAISWKTENEIFCRGYDVNDLAENSSFIGMVFILLRGELPSYSEEVMLNFLMTSFAEHAFSPSAVSARMVASGRPPLNSAIAAGIMTFGHAHGPGHVYSELLANLLKRAKDQNWSFREAAEIHVKEFVSAGRRFPGLHQPQHTHGDPRASVISQKAMTLGISGEHTDLQNEITEAYVRHTGRRLHLNVLGAAGSTLLDLGFSPQACWAIGLLSRAFSCAAHAIEEMENESPWRASRRNPLVDILDLSLQGPRYYHGPSRRKVPPRPNSRREYHSEE